MEKMEKTKREDYIDELSAKLKEWGKDLDKLQKDIEEDVDELEAKYRDKVKELNDLKSNMQNKLTELRDAGEQALEPLKEDFNEMLKDSKKGIRSIREELFER